LVAVRPPSAAEGGAASDAHGLARALDLLAALVLEDGRRWGEVATDWQWEDAEAILDPASPTPNHFLTRPRGASKTGDLAAVLLVVLLEQMPPGARA
jgi:hypothetical protein